MTAASMRCCNRVAALLLVLLVACAAPVRAHKSSDAYLQLVALPQGVELRVDVALRDLDTVVDLDADADGHLTWREIQSSWQAIEGYVLHRIGLDGCALRAGSRALERRSDGAYAALTFAADCALPAAPKLRYALFADVDPTHRGIVRIQRGDGSVGVQLLEPQQLPLGDARLSAGAGASAHRDSFFVAGIHHIVSGYDHLLFLLCLILPAAMRRSGRRWQPVPRLAEALLPVLWIVTAFTAAHSITLALAALEIVSLPARFVEPAIAATIVLAALDNLVPIFGRMQRWTVAFGFGLIHGFGFAGVLGELELPPGPFAWALLRFNLGLEFGQVVVVAAAVAVLFALRGHRAYPRVAIGAGSAAAIGIGALWFIERTTDVAILPI